MELVPLNTTIAAASELGRRRGETVTRLAVANVELGDNHDISSRRIVEDTAALNCGVMPNK